jgi:hypothetical protein
MWEKFEWKAWREEIIRKTQTELRDNIKMVLREIGFGRTDWIHLAQDRDKWRALVNTVMNFWISQKAWNFLSS